MREPLPLRAMPCGARASGCDGFALLAVLWVVVALAAVVAAGMAATQLGARTTRNRLLLARGRWATEACLAIAQARWADHRLPDTASVDLGRGTRCASQLEDPTAKLNVNTADPDVLGRLARQVLTPPAADSFLIAVSRRRRAGPFASIEELRDVPGFAAALLPLLTVDGPGSVNAASASLLVLAALPGVTPEAVERLVSRRLAGRPLAGLDELAAELSPPARAEVFARYPDLARTLTFTAPQLVLTARGWVDGPEPTLRATIELLVVPLPDRLAVIRRRMLE